MKAMHLREPAPIDQSPLAAVELPVPTPSQGEILLQVEACGLCRTDLHIVEGDLPLLCRPLIPGHQVVGRVIALGPGVSNIEVGERRGVPWLYRTCGSCEHCRKETENLCAEALFTGYTRHGGYAQAMLAAADFSHPVPEGLAAEEAAPLLCAGVIGFRALRLSGAGPGSRLGLFGFGNSAHVTIQVARHWGCQCFVFTRSPEHRALALELGADWAGTIDAPPALRLHSAIVFAPAGELVPRVLELMDRGGVVALAGIHMSELPAMPYALLYQERVLRSVANMTRKDASQLLALADLIPIRTRVETFPLCQANVALQRLKVSQINGAGVLVF